LPDNWEKRTLVAANLKNFHLETLYFFSEAQDLANLLEQEAADHSRVLVTSSPLSVCGWCYPHSLTVIVVAPHMYNF